MKSFLFHFFNEFIFHQVGGSDRHQRTSLQHLPDPDLSVPDLRSRKTHRTTQTSEAGSNVSGNQLGDVQRFGSLRSPGESETTAKVKLNC